MPRDSKGNFHLNSQQAHAADRAPRNTAPPKSTPHEAKGTPGDEQAGMGEDGRHAQIHEHLEAMHAAHGGQHSHIEHHPDGRHTSHHISHEGQVSGPHEHESTEALNQHMSGMLGEGSEAGPVHSWEGEHAPAEHESSGIY